MNSRQQRLFVAIRLPQALQTQLGRWIQEKQKDWSFQKWIHPEDIHLTLQFLGSTTESQQKEIIAALKELCQNQRPFSLHLDGLGVFGITESPKILWAKVLGELESLYALQRKITTALTQISFPPESRPYRPHVTLARKYSGRHFVAQEIEKAWAWSGENWTIDSVVLYQTMSGRNPMYQAVEIFSFGE